MIRVIVLLVSLGVACALIPAQGRSDLSNLLSTSPEAPASPPTLGEIFADLGSLLRGSDRTDIATLKARLLELDSERGLLETLQRTLGRGILVQLPAGLREKSEVVASEETLRSEEATLLRLRKEMDQTEVDAHRLAASSAKPEPAQSSHASSLAEAALEVDLEIPLPPLSTAGRPSSAARALDPEGLAKALYLAKDYPGALNALLAIPEGERSLESSYFVARCLDLIGRWPEARAAYEAVTARDPQGHWGEHSQWMMSIGSNKENVRKLLDSTKQDKERTR